MSATVEIEDVARKRAGEAPKRYGTLIRVSDELADALREAAGFEKISVSEFGDAHVLPVVRKHYRDAVLRKAKQMQAHRPGAAHRPGGEGE
jgi:hypothetical protein